MAAPHRSTISWTDYSGGDANFATGCTPVSEGCARCYARAIYERFGKDFGEVRLNDQALMRLGHWKPKPPWKRERPMCFVCDTGDLFHDDVPFEFIGRAMNTFFSKPEIDWQILTKRPARMLEFFGWYGQQSIRETGIYAFFDPFGPGALTKGSGIPRNIWIGVSVENQARADERIPLLLQSLAEVRFVSVEPMLERIDLSAYLPRLSWVIAGAESGPNRRPFDVAWAGDLYEQCREAGVAFFGKQASGLKPGVPLELPGYGVVQEWPEPYRD